MLNVRQKLNAKVRTGYMHVLILKAYKTEKSKNIFD